MKRYQTLLLLTASTVSTAFVNVSAGRNVIDPRPPQLLSRIIQPSVVIPSLFSLSKTSNLVQTSSTSRLPRSSSSISSNISSSSTSLNANADLSNAVAAAAATRGIGSHFLVRIIFLRGLAFVYTIAFLS